MNPFLKCVKIVHTNVIQFEFINRRGMRGLDMTTKSIRGFFFIKEAFFPIFELDESQE